MKKIAVLLSGRGSNFKNIYEKIKSGYITNCEISLVLSNKKDAVGLQYADSEGLKTFFVDPSSYKDRLDYDRAIIAILLEHNIDLVCLAGYMRIVGEEFVNTFYNKIINIHPSLLPSFPGLHAQRQAIEYGVKIAGCTVHFVDAKVDNGPIIIQSSVNVDNYDDEASLSNKILSEEHKIYPKAVKLIVEDKIKIEGRKVFINE